VSELRELEDEGVLLAKRLVTMKLHDFTDDELVTEIVGIVKDKWTAASALMFLVSLASRPINPEEWERAIMEEENGI